MKKIDYNKLKNNDFLRHNAVFFIGSLVIAAFNYVFYPVLSRFLSVSDFGEAQAVISIFIQASILITAFGYVVTNIINNEKDKDSSVIIIMNLEKGCLLIASLVLLVLTVTSPLIKNSLQFTSVWPVIIVGLATFISIPIASRTFTLQGLRRLGEVSVSGTIIALGKLLVAVCLILLGLGVTGVMLAYIIAQLVSLSYLSWRTKNRYPSFRSYYSFYKKNLKTSSQKKIIKRETIYGLTILCLLFTVTVLYSFDVVIARFILDGEMAGLYSGVSVISRIAYFITASVAGVLIASVKIQDSAKVALRTLLKSFVAVFLIGGFVVLLFLIFPNQLVDILIGHKYGSLANLLPIMGLSMLICSWNNLFVCYQIARRQYKVILAAVVGLLVLIAYMFVNNDGYNDIVYGYLISNIVFFIVLLIQILKGVYRDQKITINSSTLL